MEKPGVLRRVSFYLGPPRMTENGQKRTGAISGMVQSLALNADYDFKMPAPKTLEFVLTNNGIVANEPFAVLLHPA